MSDGSDFEEDEIAGEEEEEKQAEEEEVKRSMYLSNLFLDGFLIEYFPSETSGKSTSARHDSRVSIFVM